jgi:hypothetical protein
MSVNAEVSRCTTQSSIPLSDFMSSEKVARIIAAANGAEALPARTI